MIYFDLIGDMEDALGTALSNEQRWAVAEKMSKNRGGDRYYLPHLPKLHRQRMIATFGSTTMTVAQIAGETGIPLRTVKRLRNGK